MSARTEAARNRVLAAAELRAAQDLGDELCDLVGRRTGLHGEALQCPRERSAMTPCVARDGGVCVILTSFGRLPLCVGCEVRVDLERERERARVVAS